MSRSLYVERDQAVAISSAAIAAAVLSMRGTARVKFVRLPLYAEQAAMADDPARFVIGEGTTKSGKTMTFIEWLADSAIKVGQGNWWWVAPSANQARMAFKRMKDRLRGFIQKPDPNHPNGFALVKVAEPIQFTSRFSPEMEIEVAGATIVFKTAEKPDLLYGEDVRGAVCDEITRWREEAWTAVYSTLSATKGQAKLIGNVKGRKNFAYKLARKAEAGEPGWSYHKLTAYHAVAAGIMDAETVAQAKRDLTPAVFNELFLAEAASDTGCPFQGIGDCVAPLSDLPPVVWGWDLAKSIDWTVGIALDQNGAVCRFERFQKPWEETLATIARTTGPAYIDATGVGDPIVEQLQRSRGAVTGVKFTAQSKQQLMEGLAVAIAGGKITFPDGPIVNELEGFEYEYTRTGVRYAGVEGMHDDCVCALALAVSGFQFGYRPVSEDALEVIEREDWLAPWA